MNFDALIGLLHSGGFAKAVWLFPFALLVQALEAAPRFTTWVNDHGAPHFTTADFVRETTRDLFVAVLLAGLISAFPLPFFVFLLFALSLARITVFDALFRAVATAATGFYCPGVITSLTLHPLVFFHLSRLAFREGLLADATSVVALTVAATLQAAWLVRQVYRVRLQLP